MNKQHNDEKYYKLTGETMNSKKVRLATIICSNPAQNPQKSQQEYHVDISFQSPSIPRQRKTNTKKQKRAEIEIKCKWRLQDGFSHDRYREGKGRASRSPTKFISRTRIRASGAPFQHLHPCSSLSRIDCRCSPRWKSKAPHIGAARSVQMNGEATFFLSSFLCM